MESLNDCTVEFNCGHLDCDSCNGAHRNDLFKIQNAADGARGPDQQAIALTGIDWIATLLKKNSDYGSSVWKSPILAPHISEGDAILVRMSDKISRLNSLLSKSERTGEIDESFEDTLKDLGAYALLWLANPNRRKS